MLLAMEVDGGVVCLVSFLSFTSKNLYRPKNICQIIFTMQEENFQQPTSNAITMYMQNNKKNNNFI